MARGFEIRVGVTSADELTDELLAPEVAANGWLTALESGSILSAAVAAAKTIIATLADGPFVVSLRGVDHTTDPSDVTTISVTVTSSWTEPKVAPVPAPAVVEAPDAPTSSAPISQEVTGGVAAAETTAAPSEGSTSEPPSASVAEAGSDVEGAIAPAPAEGSDVAEPPSV